MRHSPAGSPAQQQRLTRGTPMNDDFRARARAWLAANAPRRASGEDDGESGQTTIADQQEFQAKLYDAGFAGITWPKEYGGQGLTSAEQLAWSQESRDYELPNGAF